MRKTTSLPPRYYRDADGNYLGAFSGVQVVEAGGKTWEEWPALPEGAVEVPAPPAHGLAKWTGRAWEEPLTLPDTRPERRLVDALEAAGVLNAGQAVAVLARLEGNG